MKQYIFTLLLLVNFHGFLLSQTNFSLSNPVCLDLMKGNFNSDSFSKRIVLPDAQLRNYLVQQINADSLHQYLKGLISFRNRNTISDDPSKPNEGIRGARAWIKSHLDRWAQQANSVLIPCELEFDYLMCTKVRHTEIFTVIPGTGSLKNELVIVEAHLDSRCEDVCDSLCLAEGADDNGSGSALLMEMARVLSKVQLNRTLAIIWITGEEQGLGGSRSFAAFCKANNLVLKAVFNNDIVGGIECGVTSSPPSCPGPNQFDSLRLRIFSSGTTNSMSKNLARMTRILVEQNLSKVMVNAPQIDVMYGEDRTGRGSDHIPFREQGYTAIRFTSSYEHGDGNPSQAGYVDRQHSSRDILGKDIDGDGILDSLYVNFNYLKNNAIVNALSISNASSTTLSPFVLQVTPKTNSLDIKIDNPQNATKYIYGIRKINNTYFDTIIITDQTQILVDGLSPTLYYVTACGVNQEQWISMFGLEYSARVLNSIKQVEPTKPIELLQNRPNPFDELTLIPIIVNDLSFIKEASMIVTSEDGRIIKQIKLDLTEGVNELFYNYSWNQFECGTYFYSLIINGNKIDTKKMEMVSY